MNRKIYYILIMLTLSVFIAACDDDTDFSSSPADVLSFTCDTVSFDTLFAGTVSSTASFLVHNRNSSSVRIGSVRLGGGSDSPFRVNVDGQYGSNIEYVEVRGKDSIFVFVDVSLDRNASELPFTVRDSLMFTLESGVRQQVQLVACGRNATFLHASVVESDTVFAPGAYIIYDSLTVAEGARLTLAAGCELYFHSRAGLNVYGTLVAKGTKANPVLFRGDRTDNMFDYLPYDRVPGQWRGVTFHPTSLGNVLDWCDMHSADYGIYIMSGDTAAQRITLTNSKVCNFSGDAFSAENARVDVGNTLIANAGGNCVKIAGGSARFIHCTIANFYVWKQRDTALALHNTLEGAPAPLREALFANCIVTGSKNDEIMGYFYDLGDTLPDAVRYRFVSSLLNTVPVENDENFVDIVWDAKDVSPFAKEHFRLIDNSVYLYDFHLDSVSTARGIASAEYQKYYMYDADSIARPAEASDAGCYGFVLKDE